MSPTPTVLIPGLLCTPRLYAEQLPALWQFGPVVVANHQHDDDLAAIAGRITGRLVVEYKLEIGATAVIRADIVARSIAVARGAVIEGAMTVTSGEAVLEFEEKRAKP